MKLVTVAAFHTDDDIYTKCADTLRRSLCLYNIKHHIKVIPKQDWHSSACHKPVFIRECLDLFSGIVIYTDADSRLCRPFDILADVPQPWDVAYPIAPWKEILSGTIGFNCNDASKRFVDAWIARLKRYGPDRVIGDQFQFQQLVRGKEALCVPMPFNYCKIFDLMRKVPDPIFVHYQASRVGRSKQPPKTLFDRLGT